MAWHDEASPLFLRRVEREHKAIVPEVADVPRRRLQGAITALTYAGRPWGGVR